MKKLLVVLVVLAVALIAGSAMASVVGTKHDMTQISGATGPGLTPGTSEVCVYCHTPHGANTTDYPTAPLWNKANVTGTYVPYSSTATGTIQGTISTSITGVTKACLSCHDGSLAVFSMVNAPNSGGYVTGLTAATGNLDSGGLMINSPKLDWNFSNDHPVGITYRPDLDSGLEPVASLPAAIVLFGTGTSATVECGSCHNVHDATNAPFLRMSNAASALCTACHSDK